MITNCSRCKTLISVKENDLHMCLRCLVDVDLEDPKKIRMDIQKMYEAQDRYYKKFTRRAKGARQ